MKMKKYSTLVCKPVTKTALENDRRVSLALARRSAQRPIKSLIDRKSSLWPVDKV